MKTWPMPDASNFNYCTYFCGLVNLWADSIWIPIQSCEKRECACVRRELFTELLLVVQPLFKTLSVSGRAACSEETQCVQSSLIELVHMQRRNLCGSGIWTVWGVRREARSREVNVYYQLIATLSSHSWLRRYYQLIKEVARSLLRRPCNHAPARALISPFCLIANAR